MRRFENGPLLPLFVPPEDVSGEGTEQFIINTKIPKFQRELLLLPDKDGQAKKKALDDINKSIRTRCWICCKRKTPQTKKEFQFYIKVIV